LLGGEGGRGLEVGRGEKQKKKKHAGKQAGGGGEDRDDEPKVWEWVFMGGEKKEVGSFTKAGVGGRQKKLDAHVRTSFCLVGVGLKSEQMEKIALTTTQ